MDAAAASSVPLMGGSSFVVLSVSIVGILGIALLLLSYYLFLTRCGLLFFWRSDHVVREEAEPRRRRGLQPAAIRQIPTFRYQSNSLQSKSDCAVCLADFRDGERLRRLPPCRHAFHIDCIDAWLQATANCPLCRATVSSHELRQQQDIVIEIPSSSSESSQPSPAAEPIRSRRSLSMDSTTDKRFYLALHHHHQQLHKSPPATTRSRSLRRSFFSFSHTKSATILPL